MNPLRDPNQPLPQNILLAMHRAPALKKPNAHPDPDPQIPAKEQRQQPEPLANDPKAEAPSTGCVSGGTGDSRPHVCITLYGTRFFDADAKYGVIKDVLDCCWRSQLIPGDREDQISLEVRQTKVKTKKEERTEITITRPALLAEIRKGEG